MMLEDERGAIRSRRVRARGRGREAERERERIPLRGAFTVVLLGWGDGADVLKVIYYLSNAAIQTRYYILTILSFC